MALVAYPEPDVPSQHLHYRRRARAVLGQLLARVECEQHQSEPVVLMQDPAQSAALGHLDFGQQVGEDLRLQLIRHRGPRYLRNREEVPVTGGGISVTIGLWDLSTTDSN